MKNLTLALVALALAACASQPSTGGSTAGNRVEEKEYRTGSRIPVRDSASASSSPRAVANPSTMNPGMPPKM
jgi:hypothetical protein